MGRLADSCANLLNSYQSSLTLTQIDKEITKEQDSEARGDISISPRAGRIDDAIKKLEELLFIGTRGKKLSQLIAESWLPGGEEYKEKFLSGDQDVIKQLLIEKGIFDDRADADRFETIEVKKHFKNTPYEGALYMRETRETEQIKFILIIPYPKDQPKIAVEELEEWINNQDEGQLLPSNPFIPLSTT